MYKMHIHAGDCDIETCTPRDAIEYTWTGVDGELQTAYSPPLHTDTYKKKNLNKKEAKLLMARLVGRKEKIHGKPFKGVLK